MWTSASIADNRRVESQRLEVLAAKKPGWQRVYAELLCAYQPYLYQRSLQHLRDPFDADDVVQEVFLNALRYADSFQGRASLKTWLTTIADNQCFTFLRRQKRYGQVVRLLAVIEICESGEEACRAVHEERRRMVARAMAGLSPKSREILSLRYWLDLSLEEIAQTLGIGMSATKMRLHRAHRQCLEEIEPDAMAV